MANLYTLAGAGTSSPGSVAGSVGQGISSLALPLTFVNPIAGLAAGVGGGLTSLIGGIFGRQSQEAAGRRRAEAAQTSYASKLAANPDRYSMKGVENIYGRARSDLVRSNMQNTNALLDRYSSIQRRQLKNKINSGLTSGAAQAAAVQNNIAFQQQANRLFQNQAQQMSNLRLREAQTKFQAQDVISARKHELARGQLMAQGITDPTAVGGLSSKLVGY